MCMLVCMWGRGVLEKGEKKKLDNSGSGKWEEASLKMKIRILTDKELYKHILIKQKDN